MGAGRLGCDCEQWVYNARAAQDISIASAVESRRGIDLEPEQLQEMVAIIKPLLKKGQSLEHIWATHEGEMPVSVRTFYKYIDRGILEICNLDLPEKVRYKRRKKRVEDRMAPIYDGRRIDDFLKLDEGIQRRAVELDCVLGGRGCMKTIFTLLFRDSRFQMFMLLERQTKSEVVRCLDNIERILGLEGFRSTFPVLLTDHGHEFNDFLMIERSCLDEGEKRCEVYYCDPNRPDQKGKCERNHVELRRIVPKGANLDILTAKDLTEIANNVNSYTRPSLGNMVPIELARRRVPEELFDAFGYEQIPADEIIMKPELIPALAAEARSRKRKG